MIHNLKLTIWLKRIALALLLSVFEIQLSTSFAQGSLTPPGPPGPTMLTLSQVEPRIPISSVPITIYGSGSYYLTGNLNMTSNANAITIEGSFVTIDLNGYGIYGQTGGSCAIAISNSVQNVTVHNGLFYYWGTAIQGANAACSTFENLQCNSCFQNGLTIGVNSTVHNCVVNDAAIGGGGDGILAGDGSVVTGCAVLNDFNHDSDGIVVGRNCVVDSSTSTSNAVGILTSDGTKVHGCSAVGSVLYGFQTSSGCTISECTAWKNGSGGVGLPAISAGGGCTISGCTVGLNSSGINAGLGCAIKDCTVLSNAVYGVNAGNGCTISDCTANYNTNGIIANSECTITGCTASADDIDGIQAFYSCLIKGNTCSSNSRYVTTGGAGIEVFYSGSRIEGNVLNSNQYGIKADGTENFIIANTVRSSGSDNYDIVSGNMVDTIISAPSSGAILGPTGGTSFGTTDPWANFSY